MAERNSRGCGCAGVFISSGLAFAIVFAIGGLIAYKFIKAEVDKVNEPNP